MSGIPENYPSGNATSGTDWTPKTTSSVHPPLGAESTQTAPTDMNPTTAQLFGEKTEPKHDFVAADPLAPKDSPMPTPGRELPGAYPRGGEDTSAGLEGAGAGFASAASKMAQSVGSAAAQYLPKSVQPYITTTDNGPTQTADNVVIASSHDHPHKVSLPSQERRGSMEFEHSDGVGALPGNSDEEDVTEVHGQETPRDNTLGYNAAAVKPYGDVAAGSAALAGTGGSVSESLPKEPYPPSAAQDLSSVTPPKATSGLAQSYQAPALQDDQHKSDVGGIGAKELAFGAGAVGAGAAAGAAYGEHSSSGPGNEPGMGKWEHQQGSGPQLAPEDQATIKRLESEGVQPNAGLTPEKQRTHDFKDPKIGETETMADRARMAGEERSRELMGDKTPAASATPKTTTTTTTGATSGTAEVDKEKSKAAQEAVGAAAVGTGAGVGATKAMEDKGKGKGHDEKPITSPPSASQRPTAGEDAVDKEKSKSAQAAAVGAGAGVGVMEAAEHKDQAKAEKKEEKKEAKAEKHTQGIHSGRENKGPAYDTDYHPAALHPVEGAAGGKDKEHLDREKAKEPAAEKDNEKPLRQGSEESEEGDAEGGGSQKKKKAGFMAKMKGEALVLLGKVEGKKGHEKVEEGQRIKQGLSPKADPGSA